MTTTHIIKVSSDAVSRKAPYIYLGYVANIPALYIGETRSSLGVAGRMAQHISDTSSNTFKKRICSIFRYESVSLQDISFFAAPLSEYKGFWTKSSEYRRAVEYLVQNEIINFLVREKVEIPLVSRVNANGYCQTDLVKQEANLVADELISSFKKIM